VLHHDKETRFSLKSYLISGKILFLHAKLVVMKKPTQLISFLLVLLLLFSGCASSKSRAVRKAERQMEQQERSAAKQYDRAKTSHYKRQAKKTKRMIKKDKRHAERMRRHQRSNPFF